ncbi:hypothetical protein MSAN_01910500 [Mycena sanguinolenta]|uniref:Uncharacterized protein n=1 Tax=Mycena sanguinolenta TaxID=230812 RepID=A0A8H6XRX2_9AGAR|nr:hypothetical protein MSAN_01910500 [Mycena sanguinolenta]
MTDTGGNAGIAFGPGERAEIREIGVRDILSRDIPLIMIGGTGGRGSGVGHGTGGAGGVGEDREVGQGPRLKHIEQLTMRGRRFRGFCWLTIVSPFVVDDEDLEWDEARLKRRLASLRWVSIIDIFLLAFSTFLILSNLHDNSLGYRFAMLSNVFSCCAWLYAMILLVSHERGSLSQLFLHSTQVDTYLWLMESDHHDVSTSCVDGVGAPKPRSQHPLLFDWQISD